MKTLIASMFACCLLWGCSQQTPPPTEETESATSQLEPARAESTRSAPAPDASGTAPAEAASRDQEASQQNNSPSGTNASAESTNRAPIPTPQTQRPPVPTPSPPPVPSLPSPNEEVAVLHTTKGDMVFRLWPDVAPKTVANFKKLAKDDFYKNTAFHRIIDQFMIQGGDPLSDPARAEAGSRVGTGGPGYNVPAEFSDRKHVRGVISMARSRDPDSAGSQFFICLAPQPGLDRQYTAFGKLIRGEDVLEKIGKTPVRTGSSGERSEPTERVAITDIEIVPLSSLR